MHPYCKNQFLSTVFPEVPENLITQQDLRDMILLLIVFGYKEPPEPPPPVLP